MRTLHRLPVIIGLLALGCVTTYVPERLIFVPVVEAANSQAAPENTQTLKGIVTAKAEKSFMVREGGTTLQVTVTEATLVTGQRDSFAKMAVGDIVRVDGRMAQEKQLQAGRIEVLFAAGAVLGTQSQTPSIVSLLSQSPGLAGLLSVLMNGGVTVQLP